jgi:hypothetical protein
MLALPAALTAAGGERRQHPPGHRSGPCPSGDVLAHHGAVRTKLLAPAGLLLLAVTAAACGRPPEAAPPTASAATSTAAAPASTADPAVSRWPVFTSVAGGYRLRYPPGWRVEESTGTGGPVLSLLARKGAGISVLITFTPPPGGGAPNAPNTACRAVKVGGLAGSRCLDTLANVVTTTLQGRERWYVLTTSLKRPAAPAGAYDRVLASFQPR